jgi:uncharacterized LabA/DUF88 family protein
MRSGYPTRWPPRSSSNRFTDFDQVVKKLRDPFGVEVEVYGARMLTALSLIQAATRFSSIDGRLLLSNKP